jgi:hypothetical protein
MDIEPSRIFRMVYDNLYGNFKPENIPQAVLILADYQFKANFVADQELNILACLTELMVNCF